MADVANDRYPGLLGVLALNTASTNTVTFSATTISGEVVFTAEASDTITDLGVRWAVKGAGAPPTYTIALQGVTAAGIPDGTTLGSATFTPPNDATWNNTFRWITLGAGVAVTKATAYAIVVSFTGTANSDQMSLTHAGGLAQYNLPRATTNNNGTRTDQTGAPVFGYRSATRTYGMPGATYTNQAIGSGSNPNNYGHSFTYPAGTTTNYQVAGIDVILGVTATTGNIVMTLETTGGTVLQTATIPKGHVKVTGRRISRLLFPTATLATLTPGTEYYLYLRSDDTAQMNINQIACASANDAAALPGGSALAMITRLNAGATTRDNNSRLMMDLIIADQTASGGGSTSVFVVEG